LVDNINGDREHFVVAMSVRWWVVKVGQDALRVFMGILMCVASGLGYREVAIAVEVCHDEAVARKKQRTGFET
jgi:hypothetical protein